MLLLSEPLNFVIKLPLAGAKKSASTYILAPVHPITIWQLGDSQTMFRPNSIMEQGGEGRVKKCGYRKLVASTAQGVGPSLGSLGVSASGMPGRRSNT